MNTPQRSLGDPLLLDDLIDHLASGLADGPLSVPAHSTPGQWLQRYQLAAEHPWHRQALKWVIDPDSLGLPAGDPPALSARQVLRFYGYPYPQTPAQRGVLIDALRQKKDFAGPEVQAAFTRLHQDVLSLANALRALITQLDLAEEPFNQSALHSTRCALNSSSFWAKTMHTAATLLQGIVEHPAFLALERTRGLAAHDYVFDPATGAINGTRDNGSPVEIDHATLLALPLQGTFDQLSLIGAQMNIRIDQDPRFSLAQLLTLHQLPLPPNRDKAWDVLDALQHVHPLTVPPACDFANADIALQHYAQATSGVPARPRWGNYWETLEPGALMLSAEQRAQVMSTIARYLPSSDTHLLDLLLGPLATDEPDECLHRLLNGVPAQQLAQQLLTAVGWYGQRADEPTTRASRDALVLGALILSLDPQAGEARYRVAGLDLNHADFWGRSYAELRAAVALHLIDRNVASARTSTFAAHLMLAGVAPECLVQDIPDSMRFMRSYAWMVFKQGVLQAEALACGVSRQLSFIDVMTLGASEGPADELPWREHCATASLIEWGVAHSLLHPHQHSVALTAVQTLKDQLTTRVQALRHASETLATPMTTRYAVALADLQKVFPDQQQLEQPGLLWAGGPMNPPPYAPRDGGPQLSLVHLHMSGHLQPLSPLWRVSDSSLSLGTLKPRFNLLGNVNALFNQAAEAHVTRLKQAYTFAIQYLLTQLPQFDRQALQQGQLQVLVVRQAAKVPSDQESVADRQARTGRFGVLVRCEYLGLTRYYELFPLINQVQHNPRLLANLTIGGEPLRITTGTAASTRPQTLLYTATTLALDWQAYANGNEPRPGQRAAVIIDRLVLQLPAGSAGDLTFDSPRSIALAQGIAQQHFFLDIDALIAAARGSTALEDQQRSVDALVRGILELVPFLSCATEVMSGDTRRVIGGSWRCLFDVLGLLAPTRLFALRSLASLKNALPASRALLQLTTLSARYLNAMLNPLDGVPSLLSLGRQGWGQLNQAGRRLMDTAVGLARKRRVQGGGLDYSRLLDRADIDAARLTQPEGITPLLAVHRPGAWYALDPYSGKPYGPALEHLSLDSALPVIPMHSADGYKAWVVEQPFDSPPLIIQRGDAIDLLHNKRVWRLNPQQPEQLDDLTSAAHVRLADTFEAICPADRAKRSPVPFLCFSKRLHSFRASIHRRRVQALDHLRVVPAASIDGAPRKLVLHRRVYEVGSRADAFHLNALRPTEPLVYREHVSARRISHEPQFGVPEDDLDNLLENQTQVLKLDSIVEGIDDSRTLRALDVTLPGVFTRPQWVVEADTGVFYRTAAAPTGPDTLQLQQLDYSLGGEDEALIDAFCEWRLGHLEAGGLIPDQPLVMLPPLETLYRQLTRRGIEPERLARIRERVASLSVMKRRELLLNLSDQGRRLDINVVSRPVQLDIWPPQPPASSGLPLNRYLAERASASTLAQVEKTGIGSANVMGGTLKESRRMQVAEPVVMWQYSKVGDPDYTEIILKTGAGNCDQMSHIAVELIRTNGGTAHVWHTAPAAHAFVVVGTRPISLTHTLDFGEAAWTGLWICDPWTSITCHAPDYLRALRAKMIEWDAQGFAVQFNDAGNPRWARANDPRWLQLLTDSRKYPRA